MFRKEKITLLVDSSTKWPTIDENSPRERDRAQKDKTSDIV